MIEKLFILATLIALPIQAHEGHGLPGAIPSAPHGGALQEAQHKGADIHAGKGQEEAELYFEAVYKGRELMIYPLSLKAGAPSFSLLSPKKDLSKIAVKIEIPRTKKMQVLKADVSDEAIKTNFDAKGITRFFVHVLAFQGPEEKTAKIQIEMN